MMSSWSILRFKRVAVVVALVLSPAPALALDLLRPPAALTIENVPPIEQRVVDRVARYTEFRGHRLLDWHPHRKELLVARRGESTTQVYRLAGPGAALEPLTDSAEPIGNASYPPQFAPQPANADAPNDYFVFGRDTGGDERFQVYRYDIAARRATPLSDPTKRAGGGVWARSGERFYYAAIPVGQRVESTQLTTEIRAVNPRDPSTDRQVFSLPGIGWGISDLSPDERTLAVTQFASVNESFLWVVDLRSGTRRLLTPKRGEEQVRYGSAAFTIDGRGLITTSDRDSEFRRLIEIDVARRNERLIVGHGWDIGLFSLSRDGRRLAYLTNEDGEGVLRIIDPRSGSPISIPAIPAGAIGGLRWADDNRTLGFTISSVREVAAVYALDVVAGAIERWSPRELANVNTADFIAPQRVRWQSFDGRTISGYLFLPPARFTGRRPVIIDFHGGPESQWRPGFMGRMNYYLNELGIALLFPNVRGSTGYGKTFVTLDNGRLRENAVRDVGALLDWIDASEQLDRARVMVSGASYGGYMSLATAINYPDRIACALSEVGITNFVSFLQNTESYRRDLRRVEYGDERDPAMRRILDDISPLNRVDRIKRPLMIVHGENDPRVPVSEARALIDRVKKNGQPVWSIIAADEGHGFAKKPNADYLFYSTLAFAQSCLRPLS